MEALAHIQEIVGAVTMVFTGLIVIFAFIPGEQPEKALRGVVNFISRFSKK